MTTPADDIIAHIKTLFEGGGGRLYGGEAITQQQHALQCAELAANENAPAELVTAALLHDIGHLLVDDFEEAQDRGDDRFHENVGKAYLADHFGEEVSEPVRLHVAAKRYLCAVDPAYHDKLSPASKHTLRIQGGPMSAAEVAAFEAEPHFRAAVRVRGWDDRGKDPEMTTRPLDAFLAIARTCLKAAA